jgi:hypothetical protein
MLNIFNRPRKQRFAVVVERPLPEFGGIEDATQNQVVLVERIITGLGYRPRRLITTTSLTGIRTRAQVRVSTHDEAARLRDDVSLRFQDHSVVRMFSGWA